jgi:membrane protein
VLAGSQVGPAGGHVIIFVLELVIATLFWWWSMHFLLLGRRSWRLLFPGAVATAACITGLAVFSSLLFSQSIISDDKSYGPIGVVIVLLEYCIGYGVCLHLGAVLGRMWNDHHTPAGEMT